MTGEAALGAKVVRGRQGTKGGLRLGGRAQVHLHRVRQPAERAGERIVESLDEVLAEWALLWAAAAGRRR